MCDIKENNEKNSSGTRTVPVDKAIGTVLSHDITEIRPGDFKGRAFKKGHIIKKEDISHLKRLGKENLYILEIQDDEMHENDAAYALASALSGPGIKPAGEPNEGKINLVAESDGLLKIDRESLTNFNMLGDVMCATVHNDSLVRKGQRVAGTRAIPLVVKKTIVSEAVKIAENSSGIVSVKNIRKPKTGIVITGNEVYHGRIDDAFEPVIRKKIDQFNGEIIGVKFAPDDATLIENEIRALISSGADLIITTGGMSVDPDDVTRFAIKNLGVEEIHYGSPVLPGAMFVVAYVRVEASELIPILGIPACGMYASITVFDLILPRVLAGEKIGRRELAELGHGGLCLKCDECRYPVCPFGK